MNFTDYAVMSSLMVEFHCIIGKLKYDWNISFDGNLLLPFIWWWLSY